MFSYIIHFIPLLLDFDIQIPEQSPTWLVILLAVIVIAVVIFALVLKYSPNVIVLKTRFEGWRVSKNERKDQKEIATDLEDKFTASQNELNKDAGFKVLPYNMKIKWQQRDDVKSIYRKNDQYWIVMRRNEDTSENFVHYVEACIKRNLVNRTQRYMPMEIRRAIELTMIKKILRIELEESLDYFDEKIYKPDIEKYELLSTNVEGLTDLDSKGLFVRAFLRELHDYGNRLFPKTATDIHRQDLKFLTFFFAALGRRHDAAKIQTIYKGKTLSVGVVFVSGTADRRNMDSVIENPLNSEYANTINNYLDQNIESIYILARGNNSIQLIKSLLEIFKKNQHPKISKTDIIYFKDMDKKTDAAVGLIRIRKTHS